MLHLAKMEWEIPKIITEFPCSSIPKPNGLTIRIYSQSSSFKHFYPNPQKYIIGMTIRLKEKKINVYYN